MITAHRLGTVSVVAACAASFLVLASAASASDDAAPPTGQVGTTDAAAAPEPRGDDPIIVARQEVLDPVATELRTWAEANDPSFTEVEVDAMTNRLVVYRVPEVTGAVSPANYQNRADEVDLAFADSKLTSRQVDAITATISGMVPSLETISQPAGSWGLKEIDGPYVVTYPGDSPEDVLTAAIARNIRVMEEFGGEFDPALLKFVKAGTEADGRWSDTAPFSGGAWLHFPFGYEGDPSQFGYCSSGFGIHNKLGKPYLLTAWHCHKYNDKRVWTKATGNNVLVGQVTYLQPKSDVAYIKTSGVRHRVFDGAHPNKSQYKNVVGFQFANAGDYLCASGAVSFARCNVRLGTGRTWTVTNSYSGAQKTVDGSRAYSTNGAWIWASGDSGGPVFINVNGNTQAKAYGFISSHATSAEVPCPSWIADNDAKCNTDGLIGLAGDIVARTGHDFTW